MPTGLTDVQVVNMALEHIASQSRITSLADPGSPAVYAAIVYAPTVQLLLREIEPDFARFTATLVPYGGAAPVPWAYAYTYPADCIRLRQVRPATLDDPNDPQPVLANVLVSGSPLAKLIGTNLASALAVYTTSAVTEAQWDSDFTDAVVRRLANPLAMAISGRPDFAKAILQSAAAMAMTAESMDEGGFRRRG